MKKRILLCLFLTSSMTQAVLPDVNSQDSKESIFSLKSVVALNKQYPWIKGLILDLVPFYLKNKKANSWMLDFKSVAQKISLFPCRYRVTTFLAIAITVPFLLRQLLEEHPDSHTALVRWGRFESERSKMLTLLTSLFVHSNKNHLLANLVDLIKAGSSIEGQKGSVALWNAFFVIGIYSGLIRWIIKRVQGESYNSQGVSNSVWGLTFLKLLAGLRNNPKKEIFSLLLKAYSFKSSPHPYAIPATAIFLATNKSGEYCV